MSRTKTGVKIKNQVIDAAIRWWRTRRPMGWSKVEHLRNPKVNCTTPKENKLALAVMEYLKLIDRRAFAARLKRKPFITELRRKQWRRKLEL